MQVNHAGIASFGDESNNIPCDLSCFSSNIPFIAGYRQSTCQDEDLFTVSYSRNKTENMNDFVMKKEHIKNLLNNEEYGFSEVLHCFNITDLIVLTWTDINNQVNYCR